MHLQHVAPDQVVQQVAPFALQQVDPFARTQTTTTDRQTSLLAGNDRHVLGVLRETYPRVRCHRTLRGSRTLSSCRRHRFQGGGEGEGFGFGGLGLPPPPLPPPPSSPLRGGVLFFSFFFFLSFFKKILGV